MEYQEYIIWGYPPGNDEYTLLVATRGDCKASPITDRAEAERLVTRLQEMGCTGITIQELNSSCPPDFSKVF